MANLDSVLKSRDISLPTKVHIVKAMVFPVVMYGCESWTIKKAAAAAKSLQSCPTLCDPIDGSPPGSPVPGILQARVLEWGATTFSEWLRMLGLFSWTCWIFEYLQRKYLTIGLFCFLVHWIVFQCIFTVITNKRGLLPFFYLLPYIFFVPEFSLMLSVFLTDFF